MILGDAVDGLIPTKTPTHSGYLGPLDRQPWEGPREPVLKPRCGYPTVRQSHEQAVESAFFGWMQGSLAVALSFINVLSSQPRLQRESDAPRLHAAIRVRISAAHGGPDRHAPILDFWHPVRTIEVFAQILAILSAPSGGSLSPPAQASALELHFRVPELRSRAS
jgi:hypothetical protein